MPTTLELSPRTRTLLEKLAQNQTVKMNRAISCSAIVRALIFHAATKSEMETTISVLLINELETGKKWGRPKKTV